MSRSSLLLAEHPDDDTRRVLVRGKGNLSRAPAAIEFDIGSYRFEANGHHFNEPYAINFAESELAVDDLIRATAPPAPAGEARTTARDLIAAALADGDWHPAGPIITACAERQDRCERRSQPRRERRPRTCEGESEGAGPPPSGFGGIGETSRIVLNG